jgi:hypothetical protein
VQALKISLWVAQPVRVVYADTVKQTVAYPIEYQPVSIPKNSFALHPQTSQGIDVEKPAVREVAACCAPKRQSIVLL